MLEAQATWQGGDEGVSYSSERYDRDPAVAGVLSAVRALRSRRPPPRTSYEASCELIELRRAIDLLELVFAQVSAEFAAGEEYERQGSVSAIDWIRHNCKLTGNAAARSVCIGEQADRLELSLAAFEKGEIGFAHTSLIAQTVRALDDGNGIPEGFHEEELLELAKQHSASRFFFDCAHVRHQVDDAGLLEDHLDLVERRRLELMPCDDGGLSIRGLLDSVGGATLRTTLESLARRLSKDDHRDRKRRMADALVELAHHGLDVDAVPHRTGQRPHLQVTVPIETLMGLPQSQAGELEFSAPIHAATARMLACDSTVTRILLGPDSEVLDVGRSQRIAPSSTRRALERRDGGCVWPGCERPASWTAAHHLKHWADGGSTNLDNLVLVCHTHHRMVHEDGWRLVRDEDDEMLAIPPIGHKPTRAPDVNAAA